MRNVDRNRGGNVVENEGENGVIVMVGNEGDSEVV